MDTVETCVEFNDTTYAHQQPKSSFVLVIHRDATRCVSVRQNLSQKAPQLNRSGCAYALHSTNSSSSSMNPRRNIARRDPEQDTNRVDPTKHVQKTQPSENDKVMLSDTEKAVALRHEESEDLALIYKPHDEANERLKAKVLLNFSRKFDVSSLHATGPALDWILHRSWA